MKTAIIELFSQGHFTHVESIAKIFSSRTSDSAHIFTHPNGGSEVQHIVSDKITLRTFQTSENLKTLFSEIANGPFDLFVIVTLEAISKETYELSKLFLKTTFNKPIYFCMHNIDFWFRQNLYTKLKGTFNSSTTFSNLSYKIKINFYYSLVLNEIKQKILNSNGRFVVLSSSIAKELSKYTTSENIAILPFSIYDGQIMDTSRENNKLLVCIPGFVSQKRRDYMGILYALESNSNLFLKHSICWEFLGGINKNEDGPAIVEKANELISKGYSIIIYNNPVVSITDFDLSLSHADVILGNLHVAQSYTSSYGKTKETGMIYTMIKSAKPGIVPSNYHYPEDFIKCIVTYRNLQELFETLIRLKNDNRELVQLKKEAFKCAQLYSISNIFNEIKKNNTYIN
jgi:hypothetical protein